MKIDITPKEINRMQQDILAAEELLDIACDVNLSKSLEEYPNLKEFIKSTPNSYDFLTELADSTPVEQLNADKSRGVKRLELALESEKKKKNRTKLLIRSIISIASAMLAVSFAFWYSDNELKTDSFIAEIDPSIEKATIILGDGRHVVIDELKSDEESEDELVGDEIESVSISKINGNIIKYNVKNDISDDEALLSHNTLVVPRQYTAHIVLNDGSEVILNAGSVLRYPVVFSGDSREVELIGEGYFIVTKSDTPFIVKANDMSVKVYGTEFNVNARSHKVEALLLKGSIGATINNEEETMLVPNQLLSYSPKTQDQILVDIDPTEHLGWINNKFLYVNKDVKSVLVDLACWYKVMFDYNEEDFEDMNINFYAPRSAKIEEIMKILEFVTDKTIVNEGGGMYSIE